MLHIKLKAFELCTSSTPTAAAFQPTSDFRNSCINKPKISPSPLHYTIQPHRFAPSYCSTKILCRHWHLSVEQASPLRFTLPSSLVVFLHLSVTSNPAERRALQMVTNNTRPPNAPKLPAIQPTDLIAHTDQN